MNRTNFIVTRRGLRITDDGCDEGGVLIGYDEGDTAPMIALEREELEALAKLINKVENLTEE